MHDRFGRQQQDAQGCHRERAEREGRAIDHDADENDGDHDEGALRRHLGTRKQKIEGGYQQGGERRPLLDCVTAVLFCPKPCWLVAGHA